MQCESRPTVFFSESATSKEWTTSPASTGLVGPARPALSPDGIQLHDDVPNSPGPPTIEFHSGGGQKDIAQPRSRIPPVMIHPPPPPPPISITEMNVPPPPPISITEMNVPPPPPLPLSEGPHSSLVPRAPRSAVLERLDDEQQSLRDLRDKLVGARFSVAAKRQEHRDLHIETSAKDGHVFNLLRQYLNEMGADLPQDIKDALTDASSLRDRLGLLEVGYNEAEASYNTLEWNYSRRESRFVEKLLENRLVPSETLDRSRSADNLEILQLTHSMPGATDIDQIERDLTASGHDADAGYSTQLSTFLAEQALVSPHKASVKFQKSRSQWSNLSDLTLVNTKTANDFHQTHSHLRWVEKMSKIDEWLFEIVDTSPLQKLCLKAMYDFGFTDTGTWWERSKWLLVQDYSKHFHTGDSTVSHHTVDQDVSESTKQGLSPASSALEPRSTSQMLLGIHPSNVSDTATLPSTIEPADYHDTDNSARTLCELPAVTREEATRSTSILQSPRRCISHRSNTTVDDGNLHYQYYHHKHARSLSCIEGAGTRPISQNKAAWISRQNDTFHKSSSTPRLLKRHTTPEVDKAAEPIEAKIPAIITNRPLFSPDKLLPPVLYPDSRNSRRRRRSSQTLIQSHQSLESKQSPASVTSHPKSPQTKDQTSTTGRCVVM